MFVGRSVRALQGCGANSNSTRDGFDYLGRWFRQCPFAPVEPPLESATLDDVRLRSVDLRLDGCELLARGCAIDTVRQSKVQAGIHGVSSPQAQASAAAVAAAFPTVLAKIAPGRAASFQ